MLSDCLFRWFGADLSREEMALLIEPWQQLVNSLAAAGPSTLLLGWICHMLWREKKRLENKVEKLYEAQLDLFRAIHKELKSINDDEGKAE